jgi:hypothetical protein
MIQSRGGHILYPRKLYVDTFLVGTRRVLLDATPPAVEVSHIWFILLRFCLIVGIMTTAKISIS